MSQKINHEKRNKLEKSKSLLIHDYVSDKLDTKIEFIGIETEDLSYQQLPKFKYLKKLITAINQESFSKKSLLSKLTTIDCAQRTHIELIKHIPEPNTYYGSKQHRIFKKILESNNHLINIRDQNLLERMSALLTQDNRKGRIKKIRLLDKTIRLYLQDLSLYTNSNTVIEVLKTKRPSK